MYGILIVLHVIVCLFLIIVVLLQAGKGGGMGIAFGGGGGGSQAVFSSSGAGNLLSRATGIAAIIFFSNSLALAYLSSQHDSKRLQVIAEKKAAEKKTEDVAKAKVLTDLTKAREAIEKATGAGGTPAAAAPGGGGAPSLTVTDTKTGETKPIEAKTVETKAPAEKAGTEKKPSETQNQ